MDEMNQDGMNRRNFAGMLAGLLAMAGTFVGNAKGQAASPAAAGARAVGGIKELTSGVYKPIAGRGMQGGHESHQFLTGMLKAGNIRLEMHESVQQAGAPHEAVGTHLHSEIWLMQRGTATLFLNGVEHKMEAGDVGLCCAGDEHWRRSTMRCADRKLDRS